MMIDRTSFDETDDFGVNQDVKAKAESYVAAPPVIMKDGKVRRRLRWRPKGMTKRRRPPPPPPPPSLPSSKLNNKDANLPSSNNNRLQSTVHSSSGSVVSQTSKHSKKSLHSFASTETASINNTSKKNALSKFQLGRPSQYHYQQKQPIGNVTTIGNEGDFVHARIHRHHHHKNTTAATGTNEMFTSASASTIFAAADTLNNARDPQQQQQQIASAVSKTMSGMGNKSIHGKKVMEGTMSPSRRPGLPPLFQRPTATNVNNNKNGSNRTSTTVSDSLDSTPSTSTGSLSDSNSSIDSDTSKSHSSIRTAALIPVPILSGDEVETERRVDLRIRKSSSTTSTTMLSPISNINGNVDSVAKLEDGVEPLSVQELRFENEREDFNHASGGANRRRPVRTKKNDDGLNGNMVIPPLIPSSSHRQQQQQANLSWTSSLSSRSQHHQNELRFSMSSGSSSTVPQPSAANVHGIKKSNHAGSVNYSNSSIQNNNSTTTKTQTQKVRTCPVDVDNGTFLEAEKNLQAIHEMASEHLRQGEFAEALEVFEEILRGQLARFGEDHYRVGTALHNIGIVHMRRRDYARALSVYKEAVRVRKKALDPFHPDVAASLAQLGVAYMERDKHRKAIGAFREALKIRRTCLGNEHPKVAKVLNNIGCSLFELNELEVAMVAFEEALDIQRNLLRYPMNSGPVSESSLLSIASTQSNIASIKLYCGHFDDAMVDLEEALLIQQCALGDDHPLARRTQESIRWMEITRQSNETAPVAVDLLTQLTGDSAASNVSSTKSRSNRRILSSNTFDALFARLDLACGGSGWDPSEADDASCGDTASDRSSTV
jgi:tetratricopeptide (TPR) repeat protein